MATWETAVAFERLLKGNAVTISGRLSKEDERLRIRQLAKEIGKPHVFILDHLNLLKEEKYVQEWLKKMYFKA